MAPSSSAKKVAKLASRGKGKRVRFQGGSVFPIAVALVVILGLLVIVYGRQSRPAGGVGPPYVADQSGATADTHWHVAYGIYVCDTFQPKLSGTKEETGVDSTGQNVLLNEKFKLLGIHSHGDGIIHYHPYSTKASGNRAKLGVFLDVYDVKLTDTELVLPATQGGEKWSTKDTKCDGKDTEMKVRVWPHYSNTGEFHDVVTDFNNIRITNDGMVMVIAVVAKNTDDIPMPDWAAQLPTLGASDTGAAPTTTIPLGDTTTTVPGGSTPTSTATTDTTAGGTSAATTTVAATPTSTTAPASTTTGG